MELSAQPGGDDMKRYLGLIALPLLTACVTDDSVYVRLDGQSIKNSPALHGQFDADYTICRGEMAKADSASMAPAPRRLQADDEIMDGCMMQKGYKLVQRP
jgi:hypothetical protein